METIFAKSKIVLVLIACIVLFSSCSNSEDKEEVNNNLSDDHATANNEEQEDNMISDNDIENEEADVPKSEFFISKMSIGSIILTSSMDISSDSDIEKEIMETLSEFDAVGVEDGAMLTLPENILFDFDSDELRSDADDVIDQLTKVMDETDGDVTIVGHTDGKGEDSYNQKLSEDRAEAVLDALAKADVEKDRMTAEGKGASDPVASNTNSDGSDNPDGRQKNRRVEITIHGFNQ
ncbi:OmpA family protein [Lentibacillus sp. CBA3610]|uniref:OmpA family protein n=1 Tax=Lentibacillus sp. CBA3610 TaxID=2518176 RepID=UPI001594ED01|nr:OmpA family protein [Lentibacillus sp. CBA3610]QKY69790.1 OmpA family protein [Lentibacillus sp. CBA3610]